MQRFVYLSKRNRDIRDLCGRNEKRRSTAALHDAKRKMGRENYGHVLECGSALPLSGGVFRVIALLRP